MKRTVRALGSHPIIFVLFTLLSIFIFCQLSFGCDLLNRKKAGVLRHPGVSYANSVTGSGDGKAKGARFCFVIPAVSHI
ncbi:MAG: hypothetical protein P4L43_15620 [Syntrophobacteraceae bacterium]|nr:hypothetical protein [Syntrophobacteraceae bacterium]